MNKRTLLSGRGGLPLFRENALMVIAAAVSLMLQIISFFTTLDGARVYFEATFAYAPLLFALAVQSVVYFLENGIRRRVTFAKVIALTLAVSCSSYFSFVGIYNNINPPESYLERAYTAYQKELSARLDSIILENSGSASDDINKAINGIISRYTQLSSERDSLERLSSEIEAASGDSAYEMSAPRRYDYEKYEDYAAAYSAYINSLSQSSTAEQKAKIDALLAKYGLSDTSEINTRSAEITAELSLISGTFSTDGGNFYMYAEVARNRMLTGDRTLCAKIFPLYERISGIKTELAPEISVKGLGMPDFDKVYSGEPAAVVREKLLSEISKACDAVSTAGGYADPDDFPIENIYTLPVSAVTGNVTTDAVVSLILAVLVDLLSLLFAMIYVSQRSVLSARSTEQAASMEGALFERNVISALQLGMTDSGESFSGNWSLPELTDRLADFVCRFKAADFAAQQGFALIAERDELSQYEALTAFLCQFGMAKTLSSEEAGLLSGGEYERAGVLLKTKFLLWVSEKCCTSDRLTDRKVNT